MKRTFRIISFMLVIIMVGAATAFAAVIPTDIAGTSCEEAVTALVEAGAITGENDGKFYPDSNLTRAQACIIIVKTIDPPASMVNGTATQAAVNPGFSDLRGYGWASGYIAYAVEQGIVMGYPDGTFKPAANVTANEMLTMVLRAAGYKETEIGSSWPEDYIAKAHEVGIFNGIEEDYPEKATKGMAAMMVYNQMEKLKTMAPVIEDEPQGTENDKAENIPSTDGMTYTTGSFDSNLTSFAGKTVSKGVDIYTYGTEKDYSKDMTMSDKADDYREETLYKFKDTKTPAWYAMEGDKITKMILPRDVGFSGNAYCVVNGTMTDVNADGEAVTGFETLTATKAITWFGEKGVSFPTFSGGDGQLYELRLSDGEVTNVADNNGGYKGKIFNELSGSGWITIDGYDDGVITTANGLVSVKNNASIYVWDDKKDEYKSGNLSAIKTGRDVRAYDVSDDDVTQADVVIVR